MGWHRSMKLRRDTTSDDGSHMIPWFGDQTLRLVSHCKHLGLHNTPTCFLGEEIASKSAAASTATKALMRPVLIQKSIPTSVRFGLVECHVSSELVAGSSAWDALSRGQLGRLETQHVRAVRGVLNASKADAARIPDDELRTANGIPSIAAAMTCRRLSYASLLSRKGLDHLPLLFCKTLRDLSGENYSSRTCG